ncbi:iron-sulfur cluster assembly scaffold protein [Agromyces sp. Soil535]|uniref:iron-sulfur cluster assembly scaffold protein n=1 Tax=Agromyces sp. Soil535 TaxID=1736390 RepID=UPI0006FCF198|nr:iron-sulfur cluster assembly scaffold protein [Agromyces sp. Soil535]KRE20967.1 hypothetical protein ASG80_14960 [Agromyces sp. Soil535]
MERSLREAIILDYARRRPGYGFEGFAQDERAAAGASEATTTTRAVHRRNPLCGDEVEVRVELVTGERPGVVRLRWEGRGCTLSQASAAMLAARADGTPVAELRRLSHEVRELISAPAGDDVEDEDVAVDETEDVAALAGMGRMPLRARCAALAWDALDEAIAPSAGSVSDPGRGPR